MKCPHCGAWTRVLSTRQGTERRRECANEHRFTTTEQVVVKHAPNRVHSTRQSTGQGAHPEGLWT